MAGKVMSSHSRPGGGIPAAFGVATHTSATADVNVAVRTPLVAGRSAFTRTGAATCLVTEAATAAVAQSGAGFIDSDSDSARLADSRLTFLPRRARLCLKPSSSIPDRSGPSWESDVSCCSISAMRIDRACSQSSGSGWVRPHRPRNCFARSGRWSRYGRQPSAERRS